MIRTLIFATMICICFVNGVYALDLSGKVVNIATNEGLRNIRVCITSSAPAFENFEALTDEKGFFTISGLKNHSQYTVKTENSNSFFLAPKNKNIVTQTKDVENCDFIYYPKYSVSGKINTENIKTDDLRLVFKSGKPFFDTVAASVKENGDYFVKGLIYGQKYEILASVQFNSLGVLEDNSITVSYSNVKDMTIVPVFYGIGTVVDSKTQKGIADIKVKAVSDDGKHEQTAITSFDGSFILDKLYYGKTYTVTLCEQSESPYEINTGKITTTVTGLNFSL